MSLPLGVLPGIASYDMLDTFISPEMHRNFYRGKDLGSVVTDEQKAAIQNGTFKGLFVGDYWVIDGVTWRIADMDYFYRIGDVGASGLENHHLVIISNTSMYNAQMNTSNTTEGGYADSKMRTEGLNQAKDKISSVFGSLVLTHREYLINAVTDGHGSAGAWDDCTVELMNEIMVYGTNIYAAMNTGVTVPNKYTTGKQQFAVFALNPKMVNVRVTYWLRDVVSATNFAAANRFGIANYFDASDSVGVRPYFCIGQ